MIFALRGLVNAINYFSSCICKFVLDLTVYLLVGFFYYFFEACNMLAVYNANNHIFRPSVSLLIPTWLCSA